jgi:hypothetical protein
VWGSGVDAVFSAIDIDAQMIAARSDSTVAEAV